LLLAVKVLVQLGALLSELSLFTSNSRIMQLHGSLQDLQQGDESVTQFMQKNKSLI
jgi:hypothetical protein